MLKRLLIIVIILAVFSVIAFAQPTNLSDRELLIQLYGKVGSIEISLNRMVENSELTKTSFYTLDKRVSKNEIDIMSFCKTIDGLVTKWNTLLTFFLTLIVGIIIAIIGKFLNGKKVRA